MDIAVVSRMMDESKETVAVAEAAEDESTPQGSNGTTHAGTRLTADEIYENVRAAAEGEMERPASARFWWGRGAGLTIGFSFLAGAYVSSIVSPRLAGIASAAVYPLGFIFVVIARNQLFTENTLEPIIPLLHAPGWATLKKLISLWVVVLSGNLVGTLIFAFVLAQTALVRPELQAHLGTFARAGTSGGFGISLYHGVYAGWLVALMAWLVASTRETLAQIALIFLTTAPISAFGFGHSIAGSAEAFYCAASGGAGWGQMAGSFILPAILGNIIGGILLVALLNHGQVVAGRANNGHKADWSRDY